MSGHIDLDNPTEEQRLIVEMYERVCKERDAAIRERDNIEARIVSTLDAAFAGPVDPCGDMSHEVARIVNAVRIRERMLATATARAESAERERDEALRHSSTPLATKLCQEIAATTEREAIASWLDVAPISFDTIHDDDTNFVCGQLAAAIRAGAHKGGGEKP